MRVTRCGVCSYVILAGAALALALAACGGGGGGGGGAPVGGAPVMLAEPVKWIDANGDGIPNAGDQLVIAFDRSVTAGANTPVADLAVLNGNLGASTWTDGPGNAMTVNLAGAVNLAFMGSVPPAMSLDLVLGNTLSNPVDGATPALSSGTPQTLMATVPDSGQNIGTGVTRDVAIMNVNTQLALDIAMGRSGQNRLYFNNGTGTFTAGGNWSGEPVGGQDTRGIALLDEDGDGRADFIVTGNAGTPGNRANFVYVVPAGPSPVPDHTVFTFPLDAPYVELGDNDTRAIRAADFNSDTFLDVVCVNVQPNVIYFGNGTGLFDGNDTLPGVQDRQIFGVGGRDLAVGQLNASASPDIVTIDGGNGGSLRPYLVTAGGLPLAGAFLTGLGDVQAVALSDLDGDGDLDAVVGRGSNQGLLVFSNDGTGTFAQQGGAIGGESVFGVACTDLNGDGFPDIVSGNGSNQPDRVWLNTGGFAFVDSQLRLGTASTSSAAATTNGTGLDGQGFDDVVTGGGNAPNVLYLTGR